MAQINNKEIYPIYVNEKYQPNTLFKPETTDLRGYLDLEITKIPIPKIFKYPDRCVAIWDMSVDKYEWRQMVMCRGVKCKYATVPPEIIKIKKKNKKKVNLKLID